MPSELALDAATTEAESRELGSSGGESGSAGLELDDRWVRRVGVLGFGLIIPILPNLVKEFVGGDPGEEFRGVAVGEGFRERDLGIAHVLDCIRECGRGYEKHDDQRQFSHLRAVYPSRGWA